MGQIAIRAVPSKRMHISRRKGNLVYWGELSVGPLEMWGWSCGSGRKDIDTDGCAMERLCQCGNRADNIWGNSGRCEQQRCFVRRKRQAGSRAMGVMLRGTWDARDHGQERQSDESGRATHCSQLLSVLNCMSNGSV